MSAYDDIWWSGKSEVDRSILQDQYCFNSHIMSYVNKWRNKEIKLKICNINSTLDTPPTPYLGIFNISNSFTSPLENLQSLRLKFSRYIEPSYLELFEQIKKYSYLIFTFDMRIVFRKNKINCMLRQKMQQNKTVTQKYKNLKVLEKDLFNKEVETCCAKQ